MDLGGERAHVERDAVDDEAQRRAVRDADHDLALGRVAVGLLRVREWVGLEDPGQEGAAGAVRLHLVEGPAHADAAVGSGEDRLADRERLKTYTWLADHPGIDCEGGCDHAELLHQDTLWSR